MNIGNLSMSLLLDNKQFAESIKTSLNLLKMFKGNADSILKGISPKFKSADFDKEVSSGETALSKLKDTAKKSDDAVKQFGNTADKSGQQTTKLAGVLTNAGLRFEGLRAVVSILKSTLGDFFNTYNKFNSAQTGLSSIASFKGLNPEVASKELQNLNAVKKGLLDIGSASTALKNLLAANFTMEQSIQLMDRLSNSAAFGRQSSLSFGEAISSATEGIKNGNSILVDNAGVTKNLSMMLEEAGFKAQDLMKAGTDAGVRMAIFNGVMKETVGQMGDVEKLSKTSAGSVAKYDAAMLQLKVKFGEFIAKAAIPFLEKATSVLKWLVDAGPAMQKLAITLVTLSTAFIVLNRSIGSMPYILISLFGIVVALPPHLKTAAIAIIAFGASMKLLNGNVGSLIGGLTSLRTKGISSISGFATTAVGKLNLIAVAASLLIAWIVLLIEKMNALDDENKNIEHWQKIRDNGGNIYMQTNDEKIDITDPKNPKKTSTFQYNYVPGKGFVGQENSTGVQYGPEIDPEQLELLKQLRKDKEAIDDLSKKTPGSTKTESDSSGTKEEISRLKELQNQLAEVGKKLELNKGLIGAEIDLLKEKHRIENEITYIQTGIDLDKMLEDNKDAVNKQINDQIELSKLRKEQLQTEMEAQLTAIDEIHKLKIDLMDNEHEKKIAQIEFERKKELEAIEERDIPIEQKSQLKKLTNKKFDKEKNELGIDLGDFNTALDLTQQIQSLFNSGSHTLLSKFLNALQVTQQIVELLQSLQLAQGIFSFISKIFGFALAPLTGGASAAGAVAGMPSGSSGGNLPDRYSRVINYISTNQNKVSKEPYFVSLKADGRELKAVIKQVDKIDNDRLK